MAKSQKRSSRETRKPKASKPTSAGASAGSLLTKGALTPENMPKQKKG